MKIADLRLATAGVAAAALVTMSACSSGLGGTSASSSAAGGGGGGSGTLTLLIDNAPTTIKAAEEVVKAFQQANPGVTVKTETRPGGTQGDNLVKTKLSTGDMQDVFWYNSGSLLQALNPSQTMVDLTGDPVMKNVDESFLPSVTQGGKVYGVPQGTAMGGGILYNKDVYSKLGLQIPKTWAEFEANNDKIKAAGITPVIETFKAPDTWTSQLFVLADFYNVQLANPNFAKDYTANKVKYATDPAAVKGFQKLADVKAKGWVNSNYGSSAMVQGMKSLATGKGAQFPMLTFPVGTLPKDQQQKIGFFGIPGDDASKAGATIWEPGAGYISKSSKNVDLAKKFLAFMASPAGTEAYSKGSAPTGPYLIKGATLPADAPPVAADIQKYIDSKNVAPALEFLSPVKGPSLEQITVAVGTGQTSPQQGAAQYDADVTKEAKQLGLPGW